MKVRMINIVFEIKDGVEESNFTPISGDALVVAQDHFRERISVILDRAFEREIEIFEMSGLDNRFMNFPIVGAAKIVAQEVLKAAKKDNCPFKEIQIGINHADWADQYQKTFEGYIRHIENTLGQEPFHTVDIIIEREDGIVMIERSNPPYGWAFPGGFIDEGEDSQAAAIREAKEETDLDLVDVRKFNVYNKPGRDPRFLTSSTVYIAKGEGKPQFGDDAKGLKVIPYDKLLDQHYAFDHDQIIREYLDQKGS